MRRGFVYGKKLNAVSHYYQFLYSEVLVERKEEISRKIVEYFERHVKEKIPLENYVIDFAVIGEEVCVIELNPFAQNTSSALFSWENEEKLLMGGSTFEFRINESPLKEVKERLSPLLRFMLNEFRETFEKRAVKVKPKKNFLSKLVSNLEMCQPVLEVISLERVFSMCKEKVSREGVTTLYWTNSPELSEAIGLKGYMKSSLKDRTLSGTILVVCLFEVLNRRYKKLLVKKEWKEMAYKGILFLCDYFELDIRHVDENSELSLLARNTLLIYTREFKLFSPK